MLPENYYLSNFDSLLQFVVETYHEILSSDELAWTASVHALPEPARRLYVRLLSRQGTIFRIGKLKYPEIPSLIEAANQLQASGLAVVEPPSELADVLSAVTRTDLMKLPELADIKGASRSMLDERLLELDSPQVLTALTNLDDWVQIERSEIFELFVMCYFGNRYQDLTEFVLRDLGHQTFESYRIDKNTRAFQTRKQLDAHWQYFQCQAYLDEVDVTVAKELIKVDATLPHVLTDDELSADVHLTRRVGRFRNQLARELERLAENTAAISLYEKTKLPPSRERRVRLLSGDERFSEALELASAMLESPIDDSELRFAERQVPALKRQLGMRATKPKTFRPATTKLTLQASPETDEDSDESSAVRVERRALQYYQQSGRCYYVENALVRSVLGLFIWDLMFMPVDGAFHHPFQAAPSDLMQPEFVSRRQAAFDERWLELDDSLRFAARVWKHWEDKRGIANALVHWQHLSDDLISDAIIRIPPKHWRALFDRLLADLRHNGKGLPDLVLFPHDEGYEFIEIKGPGDALQQHQRRWMQYFNDHQIPHRVVHIRYALTEPDA